MIKNTGFIFSLVSVMYLSSCYYDKANLIYTQNLACDTTAVKYSTILAPMLTTNCNYCHGGTAANGAGIVLDNYASTKAYVDNGKLLNSILQNGKASAMPKGGGKLDVCSINKITNWINKGAINN
jgi:mono/diheme cytochrome c family protein